MATKPPTRSLIGVAGEPSGLRLRKGGNNVFNTLNTTWSSRLRAQSLGSGFMLGLCWGYIGATLGLYWGYIGVILGLYWGYIGVILGVYFEGSGFRV